jgi:hypothetical protein
MIIQTFPFIYSFYTRINSVSTVVSFFLTVIFPIYAASFILTDLVSFELGLLITQLFSCLFLVYEIGYIFNDFHTTRFEERPTVRVHSSIYTTMDRLFPIHIGLRVLIVYFILYFVESTMVNLNVFILMLIFLYLTFAAHNFYRGRSNLVTIFFLLVFKYCSIPIALDGSTENMWELLPLIALIPLQRTIVFATHDRMRFSFIFKSKIHNYRMYYYIILTLLFSLFANYSWATYYLIISFILMLYYAYGVFRNNT